MRFILRVLKRAALLANAAMTLVTAKLLWSYLDPGSGSLIVQLVIAGILGIVATFRLWKSRVFKLFGLKQDSPADDDDEA